MQVLHDSRHGPYRTVGVFFVPRFFLYLHQQRQRPVFLQLSLTIARYVLLHTLGPFPARSKRNRARPTRGPVERRFLIEFSSIFMKILACRLADHPVTFLAMVPPETSFFSAIGVQDTDTAQSQCAEHWHGRQYVPDGPQGQN